MVGLDLYPTVIHENDLSPEAAGSDIDEICNEIAEACKGFGTDEDRLIKALGSQNATNRSVIPRRYEEIYDKNLKAVMKSETGSRDFGTALQLLAVTPPQMEVDMIVKASKGVGTNELILYPILCGARTNAEMQILKKAFFDSEGKDLIQFMASELGGDLEKLFINCLQAGEEAYDEEYHNDDLIKQDIEDLYKAGQGKMGTDEAGLFKILVARPSEYLSKLNLAYADKHGYTLMKVLEKELGGQVEEATVFMLGMKLKPYETIAKLIKKACAGFGTNEFLLTCCLIRYQPVMREVMVAHVELFGKSIEERVKSETGGDYEKVLLEILAVAAE